MALKLWGRTNSMNVQKVLWCCAELGLPYSRYDAGGAFGVNDTPDYLARNPNGLVPTIEDGGFVLWESNVIVRYLSTVYGMGKLCPTSPTERFDVERWMDWKVTTLWPALRPLFVGLIRTPAEQRDPVVLTASQGNSERAFAILDAHLSDRAYIGGNCFSMGDIPVGAAAFRWLALDISRPDLPNLQRWYQRLAERPGFREHVMLPLT